MAAPIMVPVDLQHKEGLEKAINKAVALGKTDGAPLIIVSVTEPGATTIAKSEAEYHVKLEAYAKELAEQHGIAVTANPVHSVDVVAELGDTLIGTASDLGVDTIVMASHVPGFIEHIFSSNAGYVANHAKCSVYVVR